MKNIIVIFLAIFLSGMINPVHAQSEKIDEFSVKVDGLGCPFCAFGLEKKFKELRSISDLKIEIETGMMTFGFPSEKALGIDRVAKRVDKAGYTAVDVTVKRADGNIESSKKEAEEEDVETTSEDKQ